MKDKDELVTGFTVEILSILPGLVGEEPVALFTTCPVGIPEDRAAMILSHEQCVRLRDELDRELNNPISRLFMSKDAQAKLRMD
jgi:hypothetical protein